MKLQQIAFKLIGTNFLREKYNRFFKQPSYYGSNIENGLKVKQLAKQPPTSKTLMQKILVGFWVKNFEARTVENIKYEPILSWSHFIFRDL